MGRLAPKKGIENLLDALKALNDPNIELTICGTGDFDYVNALHDRAIGQGHLKNSVRFAGQVNGQRKEDAFQNADVCIVPSYSENFCNVVAESLAHGIPVIASNGTPWEEIEEKQCGLWVDNKPESLMCAIKKMRSMPLAKMGMRGREWMEQEFSWGILANKIIDVYESLLKN